MTLNKGIYIRKVLGADTVTGGFKEIDVSKDT
jgi:hypothetical protein